MKPVIALVGRPNVGKSTLYNRLTKTRDAIVADMPGLTRDRHYGSAKIGRQEFIVIDTGGFEPDASTGIYREMARQTQQAVAECDVVIFVLDARDGLSAQDHDIANYLRKLGKPCVLVANKAEGMKAGAQLSEFYELGLVNWAWARCCRYRRPTVRVCAAWWKRRWSACTCRKNPKKRKPPTTP